MSLGEPRASQWPKAHVLARSCCKAPPLMPLAELSGQIVQNQTVALPSLHMSFGGEAIFALLVAMPSLLLKWPLPSFISFKRTCCQVGSDCRRQKGTADFEEEQELGSGLKAEERGLEITEAMGAGAWAVPSAPT